MLSNVRNDIRYALRTLRRNPGFALAAIVPIALGIGINTGLFSILNSVAWRPLPVPDADALVSIHQDFRGGPRRTVHGARSLLSIPEYRAYRDEAHTLTGLMAYSREWTVTLGRESPQEIDGILVTCNYFDVLGLSPAIGTGFTSANCGTPDASPVVVLSHALWQTAFGSDPQILQKPDRPERTRGHGRWRRTCRVRRRRHGESGVLCPHVDGGRVSAGAELSRERARQLADAGRPAPRRCDTRAGSGGSLGDREPHRSAATGPHDLADRGTGSRPVAAGRAADDSQGRGHRHGGVRTRAADRRRQRRQHAARARGGSHQGDRDPFVGRRNARPPHSAIADRKRRHRARRRGVRLAAVLVVVPGADSVAARVGSGRGGGENRRDAGSHGVLVRARTDRDDGAGLWSGPGAAGVEGRRPCRDEARRRATRGAGAAGCAAR